jgi:hypothetical protein
MKTPSSLSFKKLSRLQRLILVVLLEEPNASLKRPALRTLVKALYWGSAHALFKKELVAKSLSRALGRLEARGYIVRTGQGWELSALDPATSGYLFALCAWNQKKELYLKLDSWGKASDSQRLPRPEKASRSPSSLTTIAFDGTHFAKDPQGAFHQSSLTEK